MKPIRRERRVWRHDQQGAHHIRPFWSDAKPHEPTFTRNGAELWVTVRGEGRIAVFDVAAATTGQPAERALRGYVETVSGPAQAWFSKDGKLAFVASQKVAQIDVFEMNAGADGHNAPKRLKTVDVKTQDPRAFTPFLKTSPDGREVWFSHKLSDAVSAWTADDELHPLDTVPLGESARPQGGVRELRARRRQRPRQRRRNGLNPVAALHPGGWVGPK